MRIRFGIPLPGPFYLSGGGRKNGGSGCAMLIGAALVIGAVIEWPWLIAVAAGLILIPGVVLGLHDRRARARSQQEQGPPRNERMATSDRR